MSDFFEDVFVPILVMATVLAAILGFIFVIGHFYGQYTCGNYQKVTGKETKWVAFDDCYVKADAGWQRWDEYQKRAIASEGLKSK